MTLPGLAHWSAFRPWAVVILSLALGLSACGDNTAPDGGQACTDDFECGIGEYCKNGICTVIGGDEDPRTCSDDSECAEDEICESGLCIKGERPDGGDGGPDGGDQVDGGDSVDGTDTSGPKPEIMLTGDVVMHQDAQGTTYEINFGNVTMGVPVDRNLTIRNMGDADLVINVVTMTDDPQDEFNLIPGVPPELTIAPDDEQTIAVEYKAIDGLTDRASALIFSNDPDDGQLDVQLISEFKGDVAIAIDPATLDFGDVPIGQATMLPLTISNQGTGNAVLQVQDVAPEAGIATAFTIRLLAADGSTVISPPAYINRGDFITAEVTFEAPSRNTFAGNIVITSSDANASPTAVPVQGRAGVPIIAVDPLSIDFGQSPASAWAPDRVVSVRNDGVGDLTISAIDLLPAGDLNLDQLPALPAVISPAQQIQFNVRYFPDGVGQDTALLSIVHDDPDQSTVQVSVGGEGVQGNARPTAIIKANGIDTDLLVIQRGERVNLDGTASTDNDGTIAAYDWLIDQQPLPDNCANPVSQLSSTASPTPFFIAQRGGFYTVTLAVQDDQTAWSDDDFLTVQAISPPVAEIRQGGNDTGFVEIDMGNTLPFNGSYSSDCDGSVTGYQWSFSAFPVGRGTAPSISGGGLQENASVLFDFPGDYTLGLVVTDNDNPSNSSVQTTFDIRVKGPKAFRVTADWYDNGNNDQRVDVDLHLIRPGGTDNWNDACCPDKDGENDGCDPTPNWGALGNPVYQSDGYEDDGVVPTGATGDEINLSNPGMGGYSIKVHFRCMSSTDIFGYVCCNDFFPTPCPFNPCNESCNRYANGRVEIFVTDYYNNETMIASRLFTIDSEQVLQFDTIGVLSWPDGNFQ